MHVLSCDFGKSIFVDSARAAVGTWQSSCGWNCQNSEDCAIETKMCREMWVVLVPMNNERAQQWWMSSVSMIHGYSVLLVIIIFGWKLSFRKIRENCLLLLSWSQVFTAVCNFLVVLYCFGRLIWWQRVGTTFGMNDVRPLSTWQRAKLRTWRSHELLPAGIEGHEANGSMGGFK